MIPSLPETREQGKMFTLKEQIDHKGGCKRGMAKVTNAYDLPARYDLVKFIKLIKEAGFYVPYGPAEDNFFSLYDTIIRLGRMLRYNTLWVLGMDPVKNRNTAFIECSNIITK
ncbi:hypothetical protein L1987_38252 [Smallanthus sonchifolius]|uniref:Uncharacterized protein n=1 Tax=Smallanthus sonchifolius TaxID=185202 RepID=A0ACB9HK14_9ASTR|nr:hypothetical protein L1987_38252 [Smallanthus sonchifolius]